MTNDRRDFAPLRDLLSDEGDVRKLEGLRAAMVARLESVRQVEELLTTGTAAEQRNRVAAERALLRTALEWLSRQKDSVVKATGGE
jgi:hypothetical protein